MSRHVEQGLVQVQIVNFLNWRSTIACVESVRKQTHTNYRLIVIENASPNDSLDRLKEYDPSLSLVVSDMNGGWGAGLNLGFFHHGFDKDPQYYLTANSDVTLEPDCLVRLVDTMQANPDCAVVSPLIFESRNSRRVNNVGFNLCYRYLLPLDPSRLIGSPGRWTRQHTRKVSWLSDTVALMRRSAVYAIGGYDEAYFMYGQMTDLGYRLKQQGYEMIVDYKATAYHSRRGSSGGGLSGFSLYYKFRNWILFQRKHFGNINMPYAVLWSLGVMVIYLGRACLQGEPALVKDMIRGVKDGLTFDLSRVAHG
jgi:GT2 family glycosyltransferase